MNLKPVEHKNLQRFFTRKNVKIKTNDGVVDLPLIAWDSISQCDGTSCPVVKNCPFFRRIAYKIAKTNQEQKCLVQAKYLRLVYSNLIQAHTRKYLKQMDESTMQNIGLLLMPLYGQLIKFKIVESQYKLDQIVRANGSVHTIFAAIRQTIQAIHDMSEKVLPKALREFAHGAIDVNALLDDSKGVSDYHDRLERSAEQAYKQGQMKLATR